MIYGVSTPSEVDTATATSSQMMRLEGGVAGDEFGWSVASLGDINSDNRDDIIIGAHLAGYNSRPISGSAYVLYGKPYQ